MDNYMPSGTWMDAPCPGCGPSSMPLTTASPFQGEISNNSGSLMQSKTPQAASQPAPAMQSAMWPSAVSPASPASPASSVMPPVPTLEQLAQYNNMTPAQRQQIEQQLSVSGSMSTAGIPVAGGSHNQMRPAAQQGAAGSLAPITPTTQPAPLSGDSLQYLNGFLRSQIGRPVKVDFLIGTNTLVDRSGILIGVGANFILINESETDDVLACDFYNIKFVKFYY